VLVLALLASSALACARDVVMVTLPEIADARSALLVARSAERQQVWALDLTAAVALPTIDDPGDIALELAAFALPLSALGLETGELDLSTLTRGRPLPMIAGAFETKLVDTAEPWKARADLPGSLQSVRLPNARGPCVDLRLRIQPIESSERPAVLVGLDDERVLVGTRAGDFFLSTPDSIAPLPALTGLPGASGVRTPDGEIWLFGSDGSTAHGSLEDGFVPGPTAPGSADLVVAAVVAGSTHAVDLLAVSTSGELFQLDGARFISLAEGRDAETVTRSLAVIGPRHAVWTAHSSFVHRYRDGVATLEEPSHDLMREIASVAVIPALGLVAGAVIEGRLLLDRGDRQWTMLEPVDGGPSGLGIDVYAIEPFGDGFWAGGSTGSHTQWYPGWGFCEVGPAISRQAVVHAIRAGPSIVVTTDAARGGYPALAWLVPTE